MKQSKAANVARGQKLSAAFIKYFGKKAKVTLFGSEYTSDQVVSTMQGQADAQANVEATRGKYAQAVAAAKAADAEAKPVYEGAKQAVLMKYGKQPDVLAEFGVSSRKQAAPLTAAAKQAAVQKRQATREARHTMGSRQRQKIKGVVTPASTDASDASPSIAQATTVTAGSNPVGGAVASVGSPVTTVTGH